MTNTNLTLQIEFDMIASSFSISPENTQNPEEKTQRKVRKSSKVGKTLLRTESVHSNSVTTLSLVTSANKAKDHDKQQLIKW